MRIIRNFILKYYIKDIHSTTYYGNEYVKVDMEVKRDDYNRTERIRRIFTQKEWKIIFSQGFLIENYNCTNYDYFTTKNFNKFMVDGEDYVQKCVLKD